MIVEEGDALSTDFAFLEEFWGSIPKEREYEYLDLSDLIEPRHVEDTSRT